MKFAVEECNGGGSGALAGDDGLHLSRHRQVGGVRHTVRDNRRLCNHKFSIAILSIGVKFKLKIFFIQIPRQGW